MRRLLLVPLALPLLFAACAPLSSAPSKAPAGKTAQAALEERFAAQLAALPGAVVERQETTLTIRYPDQVLFADGAALPFPGGRELLDPLSELLLLPAAPWQGTVRVAPGSAFGQEAALADKRVELLTRYFARRGLPAGVPALRGEVAAGAPFELSLQAAPVTPASSAAEKR